MMKKLFTISDDRSVFVIEEGAVFELIDWKENVRTFCDAEGRLIPDYKPSEQEEIDDEYTDDKNQVTPMVDGFYGYSTGEIQYHPDGFDGNVGIKDRNGTKITEEIFAELTHFSNGLCPVRNKEGKWGCVDQAGNLVIPYQFLEAPQFNQYGVAVGSHTLIDRNGNKIAGTELNSVDDCWEANRYYVFGLLSAAQMDSVDRCGTAENVLQNVYDTKLRKFVLRGIPECKLNVTCFDGEEEVIVAAAEMLSEFDEVWVEAKGTICAKKAGCTTVFDYYRK